MKRFALVPLVLGCLASTSLAQIGPDVIVGELPNTQYFGSGTVGPDVVYAYSVATTSCNAGTQPLDWYDGSAFHPVIAQSVYRVSPDGRLNQIGMGWLKHGFCALQQSVCGPCTPFCSGCCTELGVGCSDPYSSALNGNQTLLGPHSDVNPFTGVFPWPYTTQGVTGGTLYKRIQVKASDLTTPGSVYFVASQYIARDDAQAGNALNNYSWRRVLVSGTNLNTTGSTQRTRTPIQAWQSLTSATTPPGPPVTIVNADVPGEGRFQVGYAVTNLGGNQWRYQYAILNINSARAGTWLRIPAANSVRALSNFFHFVKYHSQGVAGAPVYDNTDWAYSKDPGSPGSLGYVQWAGAPFMTGRENALRWDTTYFFEFVANAPPVPGQGTLALYVAGSPTSVSFSTLRPRSVGDMNCDGFVNFDDVTPFISALLGGGACDLLNGDTNFDGLVNFDDIEGFVSRLVG